MIDRTPLPPALRGDKTMLPESVAAEIQQLNGARPLAFTLELVSAWAVIVGIIAWAEYVGSIWATIVAIIVVGTRLNVLGLLVHEQAHLLGYRGRFGDLLVNIFAAYPLLVLSVEGYAQVHLAHHRDYFTEKDPDFLRKSGEEWSFRSDQQDLSIRHPRHKYAEAHTRKEGKRGCTAVREQVSDPGLGASRLLRDCRRVAHVVSRMEPVSGLLGRSDIDRRAGHRALGRDLRAQVQSSRRVDAGVDTSDPAELVGARTPSEPEFRNAPLPPFFPRHIFCEPAESSRNLCA